MLAYGATFDADAAREGHEGRDRTGAASWSRRTPGAWMPQQFDNPANVEIHARTTAREILADFPGSALDALITGVGTGGHLTGCARSAEAVVARAEGLRRRADAVAGDLRRAAAPHPIQGIGAGLHPDQPSYQALLDGVDPVDAEPMPRTGAPRPRARRACWSASRSGATLAAIAQKLPELPSGAACSASTTTPASATCRSKDSCPPSSGPVTRRRGPGCARCIAAVTHRCTTDIRSIRRAATMAPRIEEDRHGQPSRTRSRARASAAPWRPRRQCSSRSPTRGSRKRVARRCVACFRSAWPAGGARR